MKEWLYWKLFACYHTYCKFIVFKKYPQLVKIIDDYKKLSKVTGTKFTTILMVIKFLEKEKPKYMLESGTGLSTVIYAHVMKELMKKTPNYEPKLISMESIEEWYDLAVKLMPKDYDEIVEIIFGPRKKYEFLMFRGYIHTNIPDYPYEFVFLDGPSYSDEYGSSFCADPLFLIMKKNINKLIGVIDTRVSSAYVIQNLFGLNSLTYFHLARSCNFILNKKNLFQKLNSLDFKYSLNGKIRLNLKDDFSN